MTDPNWKLRVYPVMRKAVELLSHILQSDKALLDHLLAKKLLSEAQYRKTLHDLCTSSSASEDVSRRLLVEELSRCPRGSFDTFCSLLPTVNQGQTLYDCLVHCNEMEPHSEVDPNENQSLGYDPPPAGLQKQCSKTTFKGSYQPVAQPISASTSGQNPVDSCDADAVIILVHDSIKDDYEPHHEAFAAVIDVLIRLTEGSEKKYRIEKSYVPSMQLSRKQYQVSVAKECHLKIIFPETHPETFEKQRTRILRKLESMIRVDIKKVEVLHGSCHVILTLTAAGFIRFVCCLLSPEGLWQLLSSIDSLVEIQLENLVPVKLSRIFEKSYSKELSNLVVELDDSISEIYKHKFLHVMVHLCRVNNITWPPRIGDSIPTTSDLLFLVKTELPRIGWDDTKIAELLINAAKETGSRHMRDKFLALRKKALAKERHGDSREQFQDTQSPPLSSSQTSEAESKETHLTEKDLKRIGSLVPRDKRHIQIIAVGQTGMGKTMTVNRTVGAITPVGRPGQGSTTKAVCTYTRSARIVGNDSTTFQLSFTDTPGLGDSRKTFSDDDVCATIKKSIIHDAAVIIVYFILAGEKCNSQHIEAIKKLEKATGKEIDAVVLTHAMQLPDFGSCSNKPVNDTFDDQREELLSRWKGGLQHEYEEYLHDEEETHSLPDIRVFGRKANGSPWTDKMKKRVIQMYYRQEIRRGFKKWFRRRLGRQHLPVLKIENSIEFGERGKFGMLQFHRKIREVFGRKSSYYSCVFSVMTTKAVTEKEKVLDKTVIKVCPQPGEKSVTTEKTTVDTYLILELIIPSSENDDGLIKHRKTHHLSRHKTQEKNRIKDSLAKPWTGWTKMLLGRFVKGLLRASADLQPGFSEKISFERRLLPPSPNHLTMFFSLT